MNIFINFKYSYFNKNYLITKQNKTKQNKIKKAIGIALESLRLDIIEKAIKAGESKELLSYVLNASMTLVQNLNARNEVNWQEIILLNNWYFLILK